MDILKKQKIPATFFVIANTIEYDVMQRTVLKRIVNEGHTLGSHTFTHPDLTYLDADGVERELRQAGRIYENVTGKKPKFMRPPFGYYNEQYMILIESYYRSVNAAVLAVTDRLGYKIVNWNLETNDWRLEYDSTPIIEALRAGEYNGKNSSKIVLMHDRPLTVQALDSVIKFYRKLDYKFVNMEKCLGTKGYF